MITVDDNLIGLWHVQLSREQDYLAALSRCDDGTLQVVWRIRDRNGAPGDAWDRHTKRWHANVLKATTPPAVAIEKVRVIIGMVAAVSGETFTVHELLRGSLSVDEFTAKLLEAPFAHVSAKIGKGEGDR